MGLNKKNKLSEEMRDWRDMSYDVLLRIFMTLNLMDLAAVSMVCRSWRDVCQDPCFWCGNIFDLTKWTEYPRIPTSSSRIVGLLGSLLNLSNGQAHCLIFQFHLYLDNHAFNNVAKRSCNLKRLVLPGWVPDITKTGINLAMKQWKRLESLTVTNTLVAPHFLQAIGKYCPNFSELKLTCNLTLNIATTMAKHVPKLKVLSLQSVRMNKNALVYVVKKLEVLNVSHGFIVSGKRRPGIIEVYPQYWLPTMLENMPRKPTTIMYCESFCNRCEEVFICNMHEEMEGPQRENLARR